jgi:hypothetical protein
MYIGSDNNEYEDGEMDNMRRDMRRDIRTANNHYKVALWPTRLAALPVDELFIEDSTPKGAAIQAMKEHGKGQGLCMGVVVAMSETHQYSFFDAEWRDGELYFSQEETYPRLSPGVNPLVGKDLR